MVLPRALVVLFGVGALAFLLLEPQFEGRNAQATAFEVYFKDPFLAYVYLSSVPFFVGLQQAFKALGPAGEREASLRTIKRCAWAVAGFAAVSAAFIPFHSDDDDRPAGIVMRLLVIVPAIGVAMAARKLERRA